MPSSRGTRVRIAGCSPVSSLPQAGRGARCAFRPGFAASFLLLTRSSVQRQTRRPTLGATPDPPWRALGLWSVTRCSAGPPPPPPEPPSGSEIRWKELVVPWSQRSTQTRVSKRRNWNLEGPAHGCTGPGVWGAIRIQPSARSGPQKAKTRWAGHPEGLGVPHGAGESQTPGLQGVDSPGHAVSPRQAQPEKNPGWVSALQAVRTLR